MSFRALILLAIVYWGLTILGWFYGLVLFPEMGLHSPPFAAWMAISFASLLIRFVFHVAKFLLLPDAK